MHSCTIWRRLSGPRSGRSTKQVRFTGLFVVSRFGIESVVIRRYANAGATVAAFDTVASVMSLQPRRGSPGGAVSQVWLYDVAQGNAIVVELLNAHLIACAQTIGPVTSRYWWRGQNGLCMGHPEG